MSTDIGRQAEQAAAQYLQRLGHRILEQNWRTRWCEIDIITIKSGVVYFVEAKYRRSDAFGGGLDYITPRKLQQMRFAAEFWLAEHPGVAREYRLGAIEVTSEAFEVTAWLDDV